MSILGPAKISKYPPTIPIILHPGETIEYQSSRPIFVATRPWPQFCWSVQLPKECDQTLWLLGGYSKYFPSASWHGLRWVEQKTRRIWWYNFGWNDVEMLSKCKVAEVCRCAKMSYCLNDVIIKAKEQMSVSAVDFLLPWTMKPWPETVDDIDAHMIKTGLFTKKTVAGLQKLGVTYNTWIVWQKYGQTSKSVFHLNLFSAFPNMSLTEAKQALVCENQGLNIAPGLNLECGRLWSANVKVEGPSFPKGSCQVCEAHGVNSRTVGLSCRFFPTNHEG